jgi:hypothetical protein
VPSVPKWRAASANLRSGVVTERAATGAVNTSNTNSMAVLTAAVSRKRESGAKAISSGKAAVKYRSQPASGAVATTAGRPSTLARVTVSVSP